MRILTFLANTKSAENVRGEGGAVECGPNLSQYAILVCKLNFFRILMRSWKIPGNSAMTDDRLRMVLLPFFHNLLPPELQHATAKTDDSEKEEKFPGKLFPAQCLCPLLLIAPHPSLPLTHCYPLLLAHCPSLALAPCSLPLPSCCAKAKNVKKKACCGKIFSHRSIANYKCSSVIFFIIVISINKLWKKEN